VVWSVTAKPPMMLRQLRFAGLMDPERKKVMVGKRYKYDWVRRP
jgi:hypothetical protein